MPRSPELKYVRHSTLGFVLWARSDALYHERMGMVLNRVPGAIMSAGFATLAGGFVRCWGRSESLNIDSRADDSQALADQLGLEL